MPPVSITKELYTEKIEYEDTNGKVIETISISAPTVAGFGDALTEVLGNSDIETVIGGAPTHKPLGDKHSKTLKSCHTDGDIYSVTFTRDRVRVRAYSNDAILSTLETWADGIAALA